MFNFQFSIFNFQFQFSKTIYEVLPATSGADQLLGYSVVNRYPRLHYIVYFLPNEQNFLFRPEHVGRDLTRFCESRVLTHLPYFFHFDLFLIKSCFKVLICFLVITRGKVCYYCIPFIFFGFTCSLFTCR